jgi:hypothetical protein
MATLARGATLREAVEERFSPFLANLVELLESELATRVSMEAAARSTRLAEQLNAATRRLRQASGFSETAAVLADATAPFCARAAVFERVADMVKLTAVRGAEAVLETTLPPAFLSSAESGDPVTALATPGELSAPVLEAFRHPAGECVAIFPNGESGFLYAWGDVQQAPLELLAQAAAVRRESKRKTPPESLIGIAPAPPAAGWTALAGEEQRAHLRAQQFARAEVARMRLQCAESVKEGRRHADLYLLLSEEIDAARAAFREKFVRKWPSMVDYIHLEMVRTLANDDPALLGSGYPGPLV